MKVRFRTSVAGDRFSFSEGQVIEVQPPIDEHVLHMLRDGVAEAVTGEPELAVMPARARAVPRRGRKKITPPADLTEGERARVPVICRGGTVLCIGSGPSLTQEDVEYTRDRVDATVVVNDNHRMAPWADVLYACDEKWWRYYKGVPEFHGLKFGLAGPAGWEQAEAWGVQILQNRGERGLSADPTGIYHGKNSGYQAMNVAGLLGAARILLLGYDMQTKGGKHWFGAHPKHLQANTRFDELIEDFALVAPLYEQAGIEVINCSRETALACFPRMTIQEALA